MVSSDPSDIGKEFRILVRFLVRRRCIDAPNLDLGVRGGSRDFRAYDFRRRRCLWAYDESSFPDSAATSVISGSVSML